MAEPEPAPPRPILRGPRVFLQPTERASLAAGVEWFADPEFAAGFNTRAPLSLRQAEAWFDEVQPQQGKRRWDFDICLRQDGRAIGFAGFMDVDAVNGGAELLIGIGERGLRDQGLGTEAVEILLDFAFGELRLHRVQLRAWSFNERAIHVYERMGFVHEATYREGHFRHGRWHDIHYMSLLVGAWEAMAGPRSWETE